MTRGWKRASWMSAAVLVALVAFTAWALESSGVAVVETEDAQGDRRITHVWYVESDGALWLEAGAPENGWVRDIERDPRLGFEAEGRQGRFLARPSRDPMVHARLRERLRARYGVRDRWVGLFVDATRSYAVRLDPDPSEQEEPSP